MAPPAKPKPAPPIDFDADYYDNDAHFLESWKPGPPSAYVRIIDKTTYWNIVSDVKKMPIGIPEDANYNIPGGRPVYPKLFQDTDARNKQVSRQHKHESFAEGLPEWDDLNKIYKVSKMKERWYAQSKPLRFRAGGTDFLAKLYDAATSQNKEQGAYIVFNSDQGNFAEVFFEPAQVISSSARDITIKADRYRHQIGMGFVPGNPTHRLLGTIHTHYLRSDFESSGAQGMSTGPRMEYGVSDDFDVPSAKDMGFFVYAMDSRYFHRADPNGTKNNRLPRSLDVLVDAFRAFSGRL